MAKRTTRKRELIDPDMVAINVPVDVEVPTHLLAAGAVDAGCCGKRHVGIVITLDDDFNSRMEEGEGPAMATALIVAALVLEKLPDMLEITLGEDVVRTAMVAMMHRRKVRELGHTLSVAQACEQAVALMEAADADDASQNN